tara:strand:+ start:180 stop:617 length:438 start_codon:yes stop_codon:yes gene_type:complete
MIDEQTKLDFLKDIGFDKIKHKEEDFNLLHHLIGTRDLIKGRGGPDYLQDAGLFHSVYYTQSFHYQSSTNRKKVCSLIGDRSERLVYLYSICPKPRVENIHTLGEGQVKEDLLIMDKANEEEQLSAARQFQKFFNERHGINEKVN